MELIRYNKETKEIEITDNYKGRLLSSRIMSVIILILAGIKLSMVDWQSPSELDLVFILIAAVFLYLVYKNWFLNTDISKIERYDIKYIKMPKAMATKATIKLNNRKSRDVYGIRSPKEKEALRKLASDAKIKVI